MHQFISVCGVSSCRATRLLTHRRTSLSMGLLLSVLFTVVCRGQSPAITRQPAGGSVAPGMNKSFSVQATGSPLTYQWTLNDAPLLSATNASLTITNVQTANVGEYRVVVSNTTDGVTSEPALLVLGPVRGWGGTNFGQLAFPVSLTNAIAVAAGERFAMALSSDGIVTAWGNNLVGQTNVPPGLSNVVWIATKKDHSLALRSDGTIVAWGNNVSGKTNVPVSLTNVAGIAVGNDHNLAVRSNHTVFAWGNNSF
ncbi:MAG TPA: immunoglobulin domain-containing protein, partial [Candidatus Nitrosotalea sp.]|nr:immunoglobulin domain-containing protein [Candidatus Nitrosotalea sp.]